MLFQDFLFGSFISGSRISGSLRADAGSRLHELINDKCLVGTPGDVGARAMGGMEPRGGFALEILFAWGLQIVGGGTSHIHDGIGG